MQSAEVLGTTKGWLLDGLDFDVDTALGPTIHGRFDRVGGSYEVGADGAKIELAVDVSSVDTGNGMLDALLRSADTRRLGGFQQVRFRSTRVYERGAGRLRVEGDLEAAGKVEPVAFDAAVQEVGRGLHIGAAVTVDQELLGTNADRFAAFLPATVRITMHLSP